MSKSNEYRCDAKVIEFLEGLELSLAALRLVHACYYLIDQNPRFSLATMSLQKERRFTTLCTHVMQIAGAPGANDNRMIDSGIEDLKGKKIFDTIEFSENRRKLKFRFSKKFIQAASETKSSRFAMLDMDAIAKLRSSTQILFYTRAVLVQRARHPMFFLPGVSEKSPWREDKRTWLRAAEKVSKFLGHDYVIIPELDEFQEYVSSVKVKIVTPDAMWSNGRLYPRSFSEAVSIVASGHSYTLTAQELKARRNWTKVPPPGR